MRAELTRVKPAWEGGRFLPDVVCPRDSWRMDRQCLVKVSACVARHHACKLGSECK